MLQHIRKLSGSSSSSDSDLSESWNIVDYIEEINAENDTNIQSGIVTGDHEIGLVQQESSSDGESVEVIEHEELALCESVDDNSSVTDLLHLRDTGSGDGEVTEGPPVNPDDVELWRPLQEKFEEVMACSWCSFFTVTLSILIICNLFSFLSYDVFVSKTESGRPITVQRLIKSVDDAPRILHATRILASDGGAQHISQATKILAPDGGAQRILHSTKILAPDGSALRNLQSTKSLASDDVKETNTYNYVTSENIPGYIEEKTCSEENDYGTNIFYHKQLNGIIDDGDVTVDIDEDISLKTEHDKLFNYELKTQSDELVNEGLIKKSDNPNTFVQNDIEINQKVENNFKFDTLELGKTFKMLTDLNMSLDSKFKIGRSLMILDSLFVGLSDLESQFSKNSPLNAKLKKQKLRVSQGIVEEINRGITKSLDKLANKIFNKVQKLESNIQSHWCGLQNGIDNVDKNLFCDFRKEKNRNVEKELKKNKLDRDAGEKNYLVQNKKNKIHVINENETYKKKQNKENKKLQQKLNYKGTKRNEQNENKFKKDQSTFQKQPKDKNKNKYVKIEKILNIENATQSWNENDNLEYEEKIINPMNDKAHLNSKVIEQKNNIKRWNIIIGDDSMNNKTILSGEWFLNSGDARSEVRWNHHRSDWVFNRASARRNKKLTSYWFFQRAWARHHCRQKPNSDWCINTVMTLNPNAKFR